MHDDTKLGTTEFQTSKCRTDPFGLNEVMRRRRPDRITVLTREPGFARDRITVCEGPDAAIQAAAIIIRNRRASKPRTTTARPQTRPRKSPRRP